MLRWLGLSVVSFVAAPSLALAAPVLAVFELESKDVKVAAATREALTEILAAELGSGGAFRLVPTEDLKAKLQASKAESFKACYDQACQIEIGKELAAEKTLSTKLMRVGKVCVVTSRLLDLRTGVAERSATAEGACAEAALMGSIRSIAAQLVGATANVAAPAGASPPPPAASPPAASPPAASASAASASPSAAPSVGALASWEVLDGTWYEDGGFIYGSHGHLILKTVPSKNYRFAVTTEQISGTPGATHGVAVRSMLVPGKRLRGGTAELQCYGFNFGTDGRWSVFRGAGGAWFRVNPNEWPRSPHVTKGPNRIVWTVRDAELSISVNGAEVFRFTDGSLPIGPPLIAGHHPGDTYRFSQMELTPL